MTIVVTSQLNQPFPDSMKDIRYEFREDGACSLLAALSALLLAAFSGGATLDMGADYLLLSVAVVVISATV